MARQLDKVITAQRTELDSVVTRIEVSKPTLQVESCLSERGKGARAPFTDLFDARAEVREFQAVRLGRRLLYSGFS
jgi:hypothetical protein